MIPEIFPIQSMIESAPFTGYIGELTLYDALKNFVKSSKDVWHLIYSKNIINHGYRD